MTEKQVFKVIIEHLVNISKPKPIRVAINGIEGTGKTEFTKKLTNFLNEIGKEAIHVTIDNFHNNREIRYKQGRNSAVGYYEDSYDELNFVEKVLKSSQKSCPEITTATHDLISDNYLSLNPIKISNDSILLTDGAYLFKPNYRNYWDLKIYLQTDFQTAMHRGVERDTVLFGSKDIAKEKFELRYHKASKMYMEKNPPEEFADIIINNTDFSNLEILKRW